MKNIFQLFLFRMVTNNENLNKKENLWNILFSFYWLLTVYLTHIYPYIKLSLPSMQSHLKWLIINSKSNSNEIKMQHKRGATLSNFTHTHMYKTEHYIYACGIVRSKEFNNLQKAQSKIWKVPLVLAMCLLLLLPLLWP